MSSYIPTYYSCHDTHLVMSLPANAKHKLLFQ